MTDHSLLDDDSLGTRLSGAIGSRSGQLAGIATLAVLGLLTVALATWSVSDPSLSHAIDGTPKNLLGFPGATIADVLIQGLGVASGLALLPALAWAMRLISRRGLPRKVPALFSWVAGCALAAAALSAVPHPASWPLPTGLGGLIGDGVLLMVERVLAVVTGSFATVIAGIAFTVAATALLTTACGVPVVSLFEALARERRAARRSDDDEDWEQIEGPQAADDADWDGDEPFDDDDFDEHDEPAERAPILGAAMHAVLSTRAKLRRRLRAAMAPDDGLPEPGDRVEPRLARAAADHTGPLPPRTDEELVAHEDEDDDFIDGDYDVEADTVHPR